MSNEHLLNSSSIFAIGVITGVICCLIRNHLEQFLICRALLVSEMGKHVDFDSVCYHLNTMASFFKQALSALRERLCLLKDPSYCSPGEIIHYLPTKSVDAVFIVNIFTAFFPSRYSELACFVLGFHFQIPESPTSATVYMYIGLWSYLFLNVDADNHKTTLSTARRM